jgi:ribosomal protein L16 Arg81 hydroxylase
MSYNTDINWDLFFNQVDLLHGDKPILLKNFIPYPEKLVSWKDIEKSLNSYQTYWELIKDYNKLQIPLKKAYWKSEGYQDKKFIKDNIDKGNTFMIANYSIQNAYAGLLCKEIESIFPVVTDVHVYGSKGSNSTSFPYHYDEPANFIIQTYGECKWKVYNSFVSILIQGNHPPPNPQKLIPLIETTLTPGDMLYIPPRCYHAAFPDQPRLSASIPCYPGIEGRWDKEYYKI